MCSIPREQRGVWTRRHVRHLVFFLSPLATTPGNIVLFDVFHTCSWAPNQDQQRAFYRRLKHHHEVARELVFMYFL
jgi:hypothetical protein